MILLDAVFHFLLQLYQILGRDGAGEQEIIIKSIGSSGSRAKLRIGEKGEYRLGENMAGGVAEAKSGIGEVGHMQKVKILT